MGVKISKRYSSYKSQRNVFKLVLNVTPNGPHRMTLRIFQILSFRFVTIFSRKFQIHHCMKKSKTSIIWKTPDRRAKRSDILDSWIVTQHILGTLGILAFKVILGSFGALASFRNLGLMIRDKKKHFEWLLRAKR